MSAARETGLLARREIQRNLRSTKGIAMFALFFLSVALGTALSGTLAQYYSTDTQVPYFGILGGVAIVIGIVLGLMTPWLERLMGRVR